jgi:hypothetical protein
MEERIMLVRHATASAFVSRAFPTHGGWASSSTPAANVS